MSFDSPEEGSGKDNMERRIIRVDSLLDQAGITAALRRAFTERAEPPCFDDRDMFADLLKQIH